MRNLTRAVHSGQEVINPGSGPVSAFARRCHVASPKGSSWTWCRRTGRRGSPGSCSESTRCSRIHPTSLEGRTPLAPLVPSDALAGPSGAGDEPKTSDTHALEVRRTFETNRLGAACLAAAYAQIVPRHQRRAGVKLVSRAPATANTCWWQAVGVSGGIRDV
jgi:hypothetical protein